MDKSVLKNVGINFVGLILPTFISLLTVPAYIKLLGIERYGVVSLVWALIGYFSVLDLGMSLATENEIAKARATGSVGIEDIFWSALWLNLATGIVGGGIIWLCGHYYITHVIHISADFQLEILDSLPWISLAIPIANVAWVFAGALTALERFRVFNINETLGTFLFQLLPLAYAYLTEATLSTTIPAAVVARLLATTTLGALTFHALGITHTRRPQWAIARRLLKFGRWTVLQSGAGLVSDTIDRISIGYLLGARFVAFYTVPKNLVSRMNLLPGAMLRTLFPRLSALDGVEAHHLTENALSFLNSVFTPCVIVALFLLRPFLSAWITPAFASYSADVARILLIAVWFSGQTDMVRIFMFAQSSAASVAKLSFISLPPFALLLWFSTRHYGIEGASVAVLAKAVTDYALLLHFSRVPVRPILVDMSVHLSIALVALASADEIHSIAGTLSVLIVLISLSMSWSYATSKPLRNAICAISSRLFVGRASVSVGEKPQKETTP